MTSADGTTIGFRVQGSGPALVAAHGGMQGSQHFTGLAAALSDAFTVYTPDRRGRGLSGPHGDYAAAREVDDMQALLTASGATRMFGLSSGGLVTLRTALATPQLERIAVYEPPLIADVALLHFVPRYDREIAEGKIADAMVTALKGLEADPLMTRVPRVMLIPLLRMALRQPEKLGPDDVPIVDRVPTFHYDAKLVREMAGSVADYRALAARVLLMGGSKSPRYLHTALDALQKTLPHAERIEFKGLSHSGPDDGGDPAQVALALREFFA